MQIQYTPKGVCTRGITVDIDDEGIVAHVAFDGGCAGNTQGVALLAVGRRAEEVAGILKDVDCKSRGTSCPAQLSLAIRQALNKS